MKTITLTNGYEAIVDDEDYSRLSKFKWAASVRPNGVYASRTNPNGRPTRVYMHREVLNAPKGVEVDHKDGNPLHNWRDNLRLATRAQQVRNTARRSDNTTGVKGVSYYKRGGSYQVEIETDGHRLYLGRYPSIEEAKAVLDRARASLHLEYACDGERHV